jgi:hypothetical protein
MNMSVHEIVRVITSRYKPVLMMQDEPLRLGNLFWPVDQADNLAYRYFPQ